jgi:hypothetical protein
MLNFFSSPTRSLMLSTTTNSPIHEDFIRGPACNSTSPISGDRLAGPRLTLHQSAAIGTDHLAGNELGLVGCQENSKVGDILRLADAGPEHSCS